MKKYIILSLLILIKTYSANCQEKKWTLEDCISYAVTNNIQLQRQRLQTEITEADLTQSRLNVFPSLNMGSDGRIGFGRSVDPVTNLITFKQNISHSYYITSGITIFNGFTTLNTIAANRFMLKAGLESEKVARNSLIVDVMGQYYQVIYSKGLEEALRMQLQSSESQLARIKKMVETGKEALSRQYEMESRVSANRLDYTVAANSASQALTTLKQMLRLESASGFDIVIPDLQNIIIPYGTFSTDSVYTLASEALPRLKAVEYELQASRKRLAAARGYVSPRLTAGGQIFTGFYKVIGENGANQPSYSSQLKNNNSQAVFLSLEIPLFNNYRTGRNIKVARIQRDETELKLEQEKLNLYTEIENACLNYNRGLDEYKAAQANYDFNIKSSEAVQKKFEAGLVDVTDYAIARSTLFQAETEALRTKLQLMIRKLTLQFYTSGEYAGLTL
ncbi:MAG TPA: TolC family protein [Bacteroidales bacterium]|nr:TolC family protein [Bacteroidales bacterium]